MKANSVVNFVGSSVIIYRQVSIFRRFLLNLFLLKHYGLEAYG